MVPARNQQQTRAVATHRATGIDKRPRRNRAPPPDPGIRPRPDRRDPSPQPQLPPPPPEDRPQHRLRHEARPAPHPPFYPNSLRGLAMVVEEGGRTPWSARDPPIALTRQYR